MQVLRTKAYRCQESKKQKKQLFQENLFSKGNALLNDGKEQHRQAPSMDG
jgi:hypothetical protein